MFQAIEALVRSTGKIVLSLAMDGDKMMVFLTPQGDTKDAVLRQPLILSATPAELDEGFAAAVQSYSTAHKSLDEQVAATTAILQSAEKSQAGKAQKALAKGSKSAPAPSASPESSDEDQDEDESADGVTSQSPEAAAPAAAPAQSGTDLIQLLL
ncbi:PRTRC system protein E [Paraburkholderia sp. GAS334]|uniref:PRTRC system protein E n=1 Tax=Paraburkholderia sp. GAS334 TaxID=3035131 RepID=UPI003D1C6283